MRVRRGGRPSGVSLAKDGCTHHLLLHGLEQNVVRDSCGLGFKVFSIAQASPPRKYLQLLLRGQGRWVSMLGVEVEYERPSATVDFLAERTKEGRRAGNVLNELRRCCHGQGQQSPHREPC